jgi:hypothetical protein
MVWHLRYLWHPGFNYAIRQLGEKVVAMSIHANDALSCNAGTELMNSITIPEIQFLVLLKVQD